MATSWAKALLKSRGLKAGQKHYAQDKTIIDGIAFPSKFEASIYQELIFEEQAGLIRDIRLQYTFRLTPSFKWKCDFVVFDIKRGMDIAREAKGVKSQRFGTVLQLWKDFGPMPLQVYYQNKGWKASGYLLKEYPAATIALQK